MNELVVKFARSRLGKIDRCHPNITLNGAGRNLTLIETVQVTGNILKGFKSSILCREGGGAVICTDIMGPVERKIQGKRER